MKRKLKISYTKQRFIMNLYKLVTTNLRDVTREVS